MARIRSLFACALALLFAAPAPALAHVGSRDPSAAREHRSGKARPAKAKVAARPLHARRPVARSAPHRPRVVAVPSPRGAVVFLPPSAPAPSPALSLYGGAPSRAGGGLSLGLLLHRHPGGASVDGELLLEGRRLGLHAAAGGIFAPREWDDGFYDTLRTVEAHLTCAVVATEVLRLRLELGVAGVAGPHLARLGPDGGASARLRLFGPVGAQAAVHVTPVPFVRVDARAAVTLDVGIVQLRGGWRQLWLDNRGWRWRAGRADGFHGPYLGIALVF